MIEIRRGTRDDLWDAYKDVAPPYIRRRDRFEVTERVDFAGEVVEELDEDDVREVARILKRREVETVAVCFINAFANPDHEQRAAEILREELDGVSVTTSSEVLPEIFEHERFSTTVANAVLSPLVGGYVSRLADELEERGYKGDLLLLHSGGGVMTPRTVEKLAVRLAASGIAAGAIASRHIAALCGHENAIGLDMGGTSTDISLVYEGEPKVTKEWSVEYGYPIRFPSIEVLTIGAGGGSLAWIDEAGSLRNGPQSAGAEPGPGELRARRRGADEHRRQPAARPPRHGADRRRHGARPRRRRGGDPRQGRRAARARRDGRRGRGDRGRQRQHGRRRPPDLDPQGLRPARVRARRVRRRRPAARRRARQGADDPDRDRAAEPGRHLRARLPARRRPPRPLRDVQRQGRRGRRRRGRGGVRAAGEGGARDARRRGHPRGPRAPHARDRHALRRPVAGAADRGRRAARVARPRRRGVPRRARARAQLPPRGLAGRGLPAQRARGRRDREGRAAEP